MVLVNSAYSLNSDKDKTAKYWTIILFLYSVLDLENLGQPWKNVGLPLCSHLIKNSVTLFCFGFLREEKKSASFSFATWRHKQLSSQLLSYHKPTDKILCHVTGNQLLFKAGLAFSYDSTALNPWNKQVIILQVYGHLASTTYTRMNVFRIRRRGISYGDKVTSWRLQVKHTILLFHMYHTTLQKVKKKHAMFLNYCLQLKYPYLGYFKVLPLFYNSLNLGESMPLPLFRKS